MQTFFIAFIIYCSTLVGLGLYGYFKNRKAAAFSLGSRSISYWVTALSANAADMSSWLFFGLPFAVYSNGLVECWTAIGLVAGMWASWQFIAPRLRIASEKTDSTTLIHFLSKTAGDSSGILTYASAALLIFFFLFYIAAQLKGIGAILSYSFGIPFTTGAIGSALVIALYITMGGYLTVALADAFQGLFLLGMIILVPLITANNLSLEGILPAFSVPSLPSQASLATGLLTALGWGMGYLGVPHVLTKFMSIDSAHNIRKAQYVGVAWQVVALSAATAIGLLARIYFVTPPASKELLFITMVMEQCAPLLAGFVLCAILAATISTIDAQLIVCASVLSNDVLKASTPRDEQRITRLSIIGLSLVALSIALSNTSTLHEIVRYAWSGLASSFGPLVVTSLYASHRLTPRKALIGMLAGGIVAGLWPLYAPVLTEFPLIPGFAFGLLMMYW